MQGDLSVSEYCQRMKLLIDSLRDVNHVVFDPQLVFNLICGLALHFSSQDDILGTKDPFPTFASARSTRLMAELRTANATSTAALGTSGTTTLVTSTSQ